MATAILWYIYGTVWAFGLWVFGGALAPTLPESDRFRRFIRRMSTWIDPTYRVVGKFANEGTKPVMYCHHPHGQFAILACTSGSTADCAGVAAPAIFMMPFCKQMMNLMGSISSAPSGFAAALRRKRDVAILPGGVEEIVLSASHAERAYIMERKGFVKYAIRHGYDLVPIYHFGETMLYQLFWPWGQPWAVRLRLAFAQRFQIATGLGLGWPLVPVIPRRGVACRTVVGARLVLPHNESVGAADVLRWHGKYVHHLQSLYNAHRADLPAYRDKELELW